MKARVRPFYRPLSLPIRQIASLWAFQLATHWPGMSFWMRHLRNLFKISAGATGIGCFGIDVHFVFELTSRCNLRCRHCHASYEQQYEQLDTRRTKEVIRRLSEVEEFKLIVFSGGEPMLRADIYELLSFTRRLGFYPMLATNATLIDKAAARRLRQSGMLGIAASIDSVDAARHDAYRGKKGAFAGVLRGIENVRRQGLYIQINITISRYNIEELEDLLLLADRLEAHVVLLYQFVPTGRGDSIKEASLDSEQFFEVIKRTHRMQGKIKPVVVPVALPQYFVYLAQRLGLSPRLASFVFKGCTAGRRGMYYIKPNGDVWPCPFVPVKVGNVLSDSAVGIWRNSEVVWRLGDRGNLDSACGDCRWREICGGCRARSYVLGEGLFGFDSGCPYRQAGGD